MPLTRLIILLSALLVISPLMLQLSMASDTHAMQGSELSTKVVAVSSKISCSDQVTGQSCSDTVCQCDISISALVFPLGVSHSTSPRVSKLSSILQNALNRVPAVIVPPPILNS